MLDTQNREVPLLRNTQLLIVACALLLCPSIVLGQQPDAGFKGGAPALCVAAGEVLSRQPGADATIKDAVLAWHQILYVMDGTEAQREAALEEARASFAANEGKRSWLIGARTLWASACASREMQIKSIVVHASWDRTRDHLAEEPGTELGVDVARRVNFGAACFTAAEFFRKPPASRTLRSALKTVSPPAPDPGTLQVIQERWRKEIDNAGGSTAGKALVLDYYRYLITTSTSNAAPQRFLNRTSQQLRDQCQAPAK